MNLALNMPPRASTANHFYPLRTMRKQKSDQPKNFLNLKGSAPKMNKDKKNNIH